MSLTSKERTQLPSSLFGLPKRRAYPIDTISRARNALARAAQFASPRDQRRIRERVHERYPGIKVSGLGGKGRTLSPRAK